MGPLYSSLKILHYPDKLASLPANQRDILPPIHVRIKPTNICNHRCRYCAYRVADLQLGQDMVSTDVIPRDKMLELIDDLIDMEVKAVTFSGGGEPFCYPHLLEVVQKLADSPIQFASLTNGSLLQGELAEVFAHHATWLRVSVDGWDARSYAEYRGIGPDAFDRLLTNLTTFKKKGGRCRLGVSVVVDRQNASHLGELVQKLMDCGVDSIKISPCIVSNDGRENNRYHEPLFDTVKAQIATITTVTGGVCEIYDAYHALEERFSKHYEWCPYQQILPVIGADLHVYTCQDKAYNESGRLGSIRQTRFQEFWLADKEKFFSVNPAAHCRHHCVADGKNRLILEYLQADAEHLVFV